MTSKNIVMGKTRWEWFIQVRKTIGDAEKYGANTPNEMKEKEKKLLREALVALGADVNF